MKKLIAAIAIVVILAIALIYAIVSKNKYNHGICPECGERYETTTVWDDGDSFIKFRCPNCDNHGVVRSWFA